MALQKTKSTRIQFKYSPEVRNRHLRCVYSLLPFIFIYFPEEFRAFTWMVGREKMSLSLHLSNLSCLVNCVMLRLMGPLKKPYFRIKLRDSAGKLSLFLLRKWLTLSNSSGKCKHITGNVWETGKDLSPGKSLSFIFLEWKKKTGKEINLKGFIKKKSFMVFDSLALQSFLCMYRHGE